MDFLTPNLLVKIFLQQCTFGNGFQLTWLFIFLLFLNQKTSLTNEKYMSYRQTVSVKILNPTNQNLAWFIVRNNMFNFGTPLGLKCNLENVNEPQDSLTANLLDFNFLNQETFFNYLAFLFFFLLLLLLLFYSFIYFFYFFLNRKT